MSNYQKQKMDFLDSLHPTDFRNGGSFNQAEIIIDELNNSVLNKENPQEFIQKAVTHLFRQDSPAVEKAINLSRVFLEMKGKK